jgi:hypothetical protein
LLLFALFAESHVLSLILVLFCLLVSLTVLIWIAAFFFQGYIYTQPSPYLFWQAPAAAILLVLGFSIWCFSIALSEKASPTNIPVDTLFRFNPHIDMFERPAPRLWAITVDTSKPADQRKEAEVLYVSRRDSQTQFHYEDTSVKPRPWQGKGVIAVEIETPDGARMRFEPAQVGLGEYPRYVSKEGWIMPVFESGPNGLPQKFSVGRMSLNLLFNFGHLLAWFLGLWVILRFQWSHALGLAIVAWVAMTLIFLPMLLSFAASVAVERQQLATPTLFLFLHVRFAFAFRRARE